jgi:hypothetical protein
MHLTHDNIGGAHVPLIGCVVSAVVPRRSLLPLPEV